MKDVPAVPGDVSPKSSSKSRQSTGPRKGIGGTHTHGPLCKCNPCSARRRTAEAFTLAAGARGIHLAPESFPLQPVTGYKPNPLKERAPRKDLRERLAQYIYYKMAFPDSSVRELAEKMGIDKNHLYAIIREGTQSGLLTFEDPLERVEHELIPKVIDNLNHYLDAKDRTVTIEAAKGTLFRQYQDSKGISDGQTTVLALKIEPAADSEVKVMTGHIVGTPKGLPAES